MADTVLITGAAGLLGSACAEELLRRGARVVALTRDRRPGSRLYRNALDRRLIEVRGSFAEIGRLLSQYTPDAVLHLGAQTQVGAALRDPLATYAANVQGTWEVLEACRRAARPPSAVLVASSDKVYGASPPPYREDTPLDPVAPYEVSKAAADQLARSYGRSYGLPVVVTRCGNLYGPGDMNPERLIPHACEALAKGAPPRLRGSGAMTREWLYVDDAADAALFLLERAPALAGRAVNVGGGEVASVRQIIERLVALSRAPVTPLYQPADPAGEIPHQALECSLLYGLGWKAKVGLDEGLRLTFHWYQQLVEEALL